LFTCSPEFGLKRFGIFFVFTRFNPFPYMLKKSNMFDAVEGITNVAVFPKNGLFHKENEEHKEGKSCSRGCAFPVRIAIYCAS